MPAAETLRLPVAYWSEKDRIGIARLEAATALEDIVKNGFECSYGDFLSYAVFYEQSNDPGFITRDELQRHLEAVEGSFRLHYGAKNGTIRGVREHDSDSRKKETEVAAVGVTLAIASTAYGLQHADWQHIKETAEEKTLDYRVASNGSRYIEIEAKGRRVADSLKRAGLYDAAADIRKKKAAQLCQERREKARQTGGKAIATIPVDRFGVVCAMSGGDGEEARCWLVDPPAEGFEVDPLRYRVLARLTYYWKAISAISRSQFCLALRDRIDFVRYAENWKALDKQPLQGRDGEPLSFPFSFEHTKVRPNGMAVFGDLIPLGRNWYFFYGFNDDLVHVLLRQQIDEIVSYQNSQERETQGKEVVLVRQRLTEESEGQRERRQPSRRVAAKLYASPDGRVFGLASGLDS
jgi:hypothetical protein